MISISDIRQFRVLDYSIFDLAVAFLGTLIFSPLLSFLFKKAHILIPKRSWVIWTLPIGIITHLIIRRETLMTSRFLDIHGHYWLKALIIAMVVLGAIGIKRIKKSSDQRPHPEASGQQKPPRP